MFYEMYDRPAARELDRSGLTRRRRAALLSVWVGLGLITVAGARAALDPGAVGQYGHVHHNRLHLDPGAVGQYGPVKT